MKNVVGLFNVNNFRDAINLLIHKHKRLSENGSMLYEGEKLIGTFTNDILNIPEDNKYLEAGKYSAFDILVIAKYDGDQKTAFNHLMYVEEKELPFIRVGIDYFKKIVKIDRYGIKNTILKKWNRQELKDELGKDFSMMVAKYDDFTIQPNNMEYKGSIGNLYNLYAKFSHSPYAGDVDPEIHLKWTMILMRHIFGTQLEAGLKYMNVMYTDPMQALPILSLVSKERQTGKSTFIDWLTIMYSDNMIIINPEDIGSSFNGSYATKNIIAIEESKFESTQALEKLKALSTQKKISVNEKFIAGYSVPFFAKIIIASNDETKFVRIDKEEIRYWARPVPSITIHNNNILNDLKDEIPYFLKYLLDMKNFQYVGRSVLSDREIDTPLLHRVKIESQTWLYKELHELIEDWFYNNNLDVHGDKIDSIFFSPKDIKDKFYSRTANVNIPFIRGVFKNEFNLNPCKMQRYKPFTKDDYSTSTGTPYELKRSYFYDDNEPILNTIPEDEELPY